VLRDFLFSFGIRMVRFVRRSFVRKILLFMGLNLWSLIV
jgi:hypothetical protein